MTFLELQNDIKRTRKLLRKKDLLPVVFLKFL